MSWPGLCRPSRCGDRGAHLIGITGTDPRIKSGDGDDREEERKSIRPARGGPNGCSVEEIFRIGLGGALHAACHRHAAEAVAVVDVVAELDDAVGGRPGRDVDPVDGDRRG